MPIELVQSPSQYLGSRPLRVNKRTGEVLVKTERGIMVNSQLTREEWRQLDTVIQPAAKTRLRAVGDLKARGLTRNLPSLGILTAQYSKGGELTAANVTMTGQGISERDRLDFKLGGVPVPIIFKEFIIPKRQLEASRLTGQPLDTATAAAAVRVVAEQAETLLLNGNASIVFDGNTIYGYTTAPNRNTDTAANYGGGDWGTISNVVPTIAGMISAAQGDYMFGPYMVYVATTQYNQGALSFYSDGSGQTPLDRIKMLPNILGVEAVDNLAAGTVLLVQMSEDVVVWAEHMDITVLEWMSGDGMVAFFKVMMVATPVVRDDYNSRSGIVHATSA